VTTDRHGLFASAAFEGAVARQPLAPAEPKERLGRSGERPPADGDSPRMVPSQPPKHIRIPLLIDLVIVEDPAQIAELNEHPNVSRVVPRVGALLARTIAHRISGTLTVGTERLPAFAGRSDAVRERRQRKLTEGLPVSRAEALRSTPEFAELARYVAGGDLPRDVGVVAQQLIGRLFVPDYRASAATYAAAHVIAAWPRALPPQAWWWSVSGTLERSKRLLWSAAQDDPSAIHATAIAVHNLVDTVKRMRARLAASGPTESAAEAVRDCLVAPPALLRSCVAETEVSFLDRPLGAGTLVIFRLQAAYERTRDVGFAFAESGWNECPAHAFVPALLEELWAAGAMIAPASRSSTLASEDGAEREALVSRAMSAVFEGGFSALNRVLPWHRLPTWVAVVNLLALRNVLRKQNLYDTEAPGASQGTETPVSAEALSTRGSDGSFNDLASPKMGAAGVRFGRNFPREVTHPDEARLLTPNPRVISQRLLRREHFVPATSLNLLAAAWIQFQVHDWFNHKLSDEDHAKIPIDAGDDWFEKPMRVRRTARDVHPADPADAPPAYANAHSHWWDASQLYGVTAATQHTVRAHADGKLKILSDGRLPYDPETGIDITGANDNWWIGLSLLHTLFTLEHNAICDHLRSEYPTWSDDRLFAKARLVNAALIAKIHTVEWTPGILAHPALQIGMSANWWGLVGERLTKLLGRLGDGEAISGIPGSPTDHHSAPYALTEEFAAVYRMHPLMPDDYEIHAFADGRLLKNLTLHDVSGRNTRKVLDEVATLDLLYSFGIAHPGAITLHNYPRSLQDLVRLDGERMDLASVEIFRDRERGIPRYNEFRRHLHMPAVRSFEELTPNREWARELREVYGDVENVDVMVGMYAEEPPKGFGFSDTAFRVFILMASRRLKSDRFFTSDFTPAVYTPLGIEWVQANDMRTVLMRHHPELAPALRLVNNAFAPWRRV
jgi:hypothetical protein